MTLRWDCVAFHLSHFRGIDVQDRYHTECCGATGHRKKANQLTALVFLLPVDVIRKAGVGTIAIPFAAGGGSLPRRLQ